MIKVLIKFQYMGLTFDVDLIKKLWHNPDV